MRFIPCGQGIVDHPVSGRPITTEVVEQVGFGRIGEYIDLTGEGYAFRLLLAAPELLDACRDVCDNWEHGDLAAAARLCAAAIAKAEGAIP